MIQITFTTMKFIIMPCVRKTLLSAQSIHFDLLTVLNLQLASQHLGNIERGLCALAAGCGGSFRRGRLAIMEEPKATLQNRFVYSQIKEHMHVVIRSRL